MLFQVPTQEVMLQYSVQNSMPVYGYIQAHRPSLQFLSTISSVPALMAQLGCSHASELFFLFGLDGSESHQYLSSKDMAVGDLETEFKEPSKAEEGKGFEDRERDMALEMMRSWGDFAKGSKDKAPWKALNSQDSNSNSKDPSNLYLKVFSNCPQLGASSDAAKAALLADLKKDSDLKGEVMQLKEANSWKERVGSSGASMEEKFDLWMKDDGEVIWECYYGDKRMKWET